MFKVNKFIIVSIPLLIFMIITSIYFFRFFYPELSVIVTPDFGQSDILHGYYPIKKLLSDSLKNGSIALWNKQMAMGHPIYAEGQMGTFMAVNVILFRLFPAFMAINLGYVVMFLQMAVGTYLFARALKLSIVSSIFAGIVFSFSGYSIVQMVHYSQLQSISFVPLLFFVIQQYLNTNKKWYLLLYSIIQSQQILTGHQQTTLYTVLGLFFYFVCVLFIVDNKKGLLRKSALFIGASLLSLVLSAVLLLPNIELLSYSLRGASTSILSSFPYPPVHIKAFLNPYIFGDPRIGTYPGYSEDWGIFWENTSYIGILPIMLMIAGLFLIKKKKYLIVFYTLAFVSLLLVLGKSSPLYFLYSFPPLGYFRVPSRFLIFIILSLAIIAGFVIDRFIKNRSKTVVIISAAILLSIQVGDVFYYFYNYHAVAPASSWFQTPKTAEFIKKDIGHDRYISLTDIIPKDWNDIFLEKGWQEPQDYFKFQEALMGHQNLFYGLNKANAMTALPTRSQLYFMNYPLGDITISDDNVVSFDPLVQEVLNMASVRYIILQNALKIDSLKNVYQDDFVTIYENDQVYPRARFVYDYQVAGTVEKSYELLRDESFDGKRVAILSNDAAFEKSGDKDIPQSIEWEQDDQEEAALHVTTERDGLLVLADSYYPGWQARLDGSETTILRANINQRAIVVLAGEHTIEFVYRPQSFYRGAIISIVGYGAVFTILFSLLFRRK